MSFKSQFNDESSSDSRSRERDPNLKNAANSERGKGSAGSEALDLDEISELFLKEYRAGKKPTVEEFAARFPQFAEEITDLFPALSLLERESGNDSISNYSSSVARKGIEPTDLKRLKNFRIIREIGRGGMGVVYEAWDEALERIVALKVMKIFPGEEEQTLNRFRREARTAAGLHHTNIVPVYGYDAVDDHFFYSMQLIDGVSLDEFMSLRERDALRDVEPDSRFARLVDLAQKRFGAQTKFGASKHEDPIFNRNSDQELPRLGIGGDAVPRPEAQNVNATSTKVDKSKVDDATENKPKSATSSRSKENVRKGTKASLKSSQKKPRVGVKPDFDAFISKSQGALCATNVTDATYYQRVADLGLQAARALDYASRHNVVHRDIKPSNIIIDRDGALWITDFGLAKRLSENDLTRQGQLVGTLRYLAPEALEGSFSPLSDVYSLGLTLYEMLTYVPAFDETNYAKLLAQVSHADPVRPRAINPKIPVDLETIILKAIERDPERRYSAAQLADDLQRFIEGRPVLARRINPIARAWRWCKRNKLLSTLEATIALMLVTFAVVSFHNKRVLEKQNERLVSQKIELQVRKARTDALNSQLEGANEQLNRLVKEKEEETKRANENVQLALDSFDKLSDAILSNSDVEIDFFDDASAFYPAVDESSISRKEANALREMLGFYNDFAKANKDFADNWEMAFRTASAFHRIGVISKTLGTGSYLDVLKTAFTFYQASLENIPDAQEKEEQIALEMARLTIVLLDNAPPREDLFVVNSCATALDAMNVVSSGKNADLRDTLTARLHFSRANFFTRLLRRQQLPEELGFRIAAPKRIAILPETRRFVEADFNFVRERVAALKSSQDVGKLRLSAHYYSVRALWDSFLGKYGDAELDVLQGERIVAKLIELDSNDPLAYLSRLLSLYVETWIYLESELSGSPLLTSDEKDRAVVKAQEETLRCVNELAERFPATFNDMSRVSAYLYFAKIAYFLDDRNGANELMKNGAECVERMLAAHPNVNAKSFAVHFFSSFVECLVLQGKYDQARDLLDRIDEELKDLKDDEMTQTFYERALKHANKARKLVEASNAEPAPQ